VEPKVGIYFVVDGKITSEGVPVSQGEPYGEAIQHGGYREFREQYERKSAIGEQF